MDLTKEALKYLAENTIKPEERVVEIDGSNFVIDETGHYDRVRPKVYNAKSPLVMRTLTGLVDYIKSNLERQESKLLLHVEKPTEVSLLGLLAEDGSREYLASAQAIVPGFSFNSFLNIEEFNVALQSTFVKNNDREILLKVVGNLKEDNVKTTGDDGVSQAVTIKTGIASAADVKVPNPVTLAPYRTFVEVEQPESKFIFRMQGGPRGAIFEAEGGAWRNQAILNIKKYLENQLSDEIKNGKITILA